MNRLTDVVKNLIIINVLVFIAVLTLPEAFSHYSAMGQLYFFKSDYFRPFQIVTSMFMHADLRHLFMNMLGLFFLGPIVERALGPKRFFIIYIVAGIGAVLLHFGVKYYDFINIDCVQCRQYAELMYTPMVGASGAVYGVVIAFATMFPDKKLIIFPIPIPIKALYIGIGSVVMALFFGITDTQAGGIAHFAHLGGALTGFLMIHYWKMANLR